MLGNVGRKIQSEHRDGDSDYQSDIPVSCSDML